MEKVALVLVLVEMHSRGCFVGRCAARPAVRGGAPSLSSVAELVGRRLRHDGRVATAVLGRADAHVQPALGLVVTADAGCLSNRFCSVLLCPVHGLDPIPQRVVPSGGAAREAAAGTLARSAAFPSTDLADVRGFNFTFVLAPAEGLHGPDRRIRARYSDFAICSCGGILQICQCTASATRAPCGQSP